jgi:hypothetical protein
LGSMSKNTLQGQISNFLRPFFLLGARWLLVGLPDTSGGRIRSSLSILFHHSYPHSHIISRMNNRSIRGRLSETQSHPIIIDQSVHMNFKVSRICVCAHQEDKYRLN